MANFPIYQAGVFYQASTLVFDNAGNLWESLVNVSNVTPGTDATKWREVGTVGSPSPLHTGVPVVRKFPFAFDTPNLLTGAAVYTPTIGDILMDAWIQINTPWDGTTPCGDIGSFASGNFGLWGFGIGPLDMTGQDFTFDGLQVGNGNVTPQVTPTRGMWSDLLTAANTEGSVQPGQTVNYVGPIRFLPGIFVNADPIKVVVSQDGTTIGASPGPTQGAAVLYLVTVTPI